MRGSRAIRAASDLGSQNEVPMNGDKPRAHSRIWGQNITLHLMTCISDLYNQHSRTTHEFSHGFREQWPLLKNLQLKEGLDFWPGRRGGSFFSSLIWSLLTFALGSCQNKTCLLKCSTHSVLFSFLMFCLAASNLFMRRNHFLGPRSKKSSPVTAEP